MNSVPPTNRHKLPAEVLVLSGICLMGGFMLVRTALFALATGGRFFAPVTDRGAAIMHFAIYLESLDPVVLFVSTGMTLAGTISLLSRKPRVPGDIKLADTGFVIIGVIASGIGVLFSAGVALGLILGRR